MNRRFPNPIRYDQAPSGVSTEVSSSLDHLRPGHSAATSHDLTTDVGMRRAMQAAGERLGAASESSEQTAQAEQTIQSSEHIQSAVPNIPYITSSILERSPVANSAQFAGDTDFQKAKYLQEHQQNYNSSEALKSRQHQETMSNTHYQRGAADLKAAGYNPALILGGAGAGNVSSAQATSGQAGVHRKEATGSD